MWALCKIVWTLCPALSFLLLKSSRVQYAGSAWDELKHIRQAVGFLVSFICISLPYPITHSCNFIFIFADRLLSFNFLTTQVIHQKPKKSLNEITKELCPVSASSLQNFSILNFDSCFFSWLFFSLLLLAPCLLLQVLSIQQLYRISTMYWDDKYGTHSVSSDVSWVWLAVNSF